MQVVGTEGQAYGLYLVHHAVVVIESWVVVIYWLAVYDHFPYFSVETDINGCCKQIGSYFNEVFNAIGDSQHGSFAIVVACHIVNCQGHVCQMADDIRGVCVANMVWDV